MQAADEDQDLVSNDLGPLAWVLDELRKSLESASSALRRFVRDAAHARSQDMASVDTGHLRIARQHMHQAVGALEMVGLVAPAHMLRGMEAAAQKFIERPQLCTEAAAAKVERAGFALTEYLEALLGGKNVSPLMLFPQYKDVQDLAGADRVHPADLWSTEWHWHELPAPADVAPLHYEASTRARIDQAVLRIVKTADAAAGHALAEVSLGLSAAQSARHPKIFWRIAAGYFEALGLGLLPADLYVKRAASRVLLQYASLAKGELAVSDRLAQDLVFFCAQAVPQRPVDAPALMAVRQGYGLLDAAPVDYTTSPFGRFDPVLVAQMRKRIGSAKEAWSALAGGDAHRIKGAADQFHGVRETLVKLHPPSGPLARALDAAMESVARAGTVPSAELAMEVATAVLYLEAAFQDLDPDDGALADRTTRLADRLTRVVQGGQPEPLEHWVEDLYRRVSDRQTMGSVVGELRSTLNELEKLLDHFFRHPAEKGALREAPNFLAQMRGVLSVLGLDQASLAVQRMRDTVEDLMVAEVDADPTRAAATFEELGTNLGALGFLLDMLNYQPTLAKKLFVWDDARGELRPLMGREAGAEPPPAAAPALVLRPPAMAPVAAVSTSAPLAALLQAAPAPLAPDEDGSEEDELLDIFLEEAREAVQTALAAIEDLSAEPSGLAEMTTLRRAFHTLKGSARMVGLNEFGEAAWSLEQVMNTWLADQKDATEDLRALCSQALVLLGRWAEDIARGTVDSWKASLFRSAADTMRTEARLVPIPMPHPDAPAVIEPGAGAPAHAPDDETLTSLEPAAPAAGNRVASIEEAPAATLAPEVPELEGVDFDFTVEPAAQPAVPHAGAELERAATPEAAGMRDEELPAMRGAPEAMVELGGFDFTSLDAIAAAAAPIEFAAPEVPPALPVLMEPPALEPLAEAANDAIEAVAPRDEQMKVIGTLRVGIPLYNVYLNEADEWSRRLATEISEWALEMNQRLPDSTVGWAHALAGSSATVGFHALSDIARALEAALQHTQCLAHGTPAHARIFTRAAEEVRRLLHQFAAGFLKEPDPRVLDALLELKNVAGELRTEAPGSELPPHVDLADLDFSGLPPQAAGEVPVATHPAATLLPPVRSVPVARQVAMAAVSDDDDLDVVDAIDPDLFAIFEEEAAELMPTLANSLRQWSAQPDQREPRDQVLRVLHTLKGSARLAGALQLGELAHRMESEVEYLAGNRIAAADVDMLLQRFDAMQARFDALRATGGLPAEQQGETPAAPAFVAVQRTATAPLAETAAPQLPAIGPNGVARPLRGLILPPVPTATAQSRQASNQAVRVRSELLDRLVNQAGEVMITRSRLENELGQLRSALGDLTVNLDRLRSQLRDIELQAESQMQSRMAQARDTASGFDPLEFDRFTRVQELTRMMAESVNDVATVQRNIQRVVDATEDDLVAQARQTRELQRDLLRTRMVEFEGISDRLYRVVRLAAKESGKQVKLDIVGGSIEMDRGVLDRMTPAFEHLLRNCVAHGVEAPDTRVAGGKDAVGTIVVTVRQEGNDVSVEFRDDGAGLNLARIREKALQQDLITTQQQISDEEAANLIFLPGFTTAQQVTELAGRGIGMDVVRSEVNALGGRIETSTRAGQGTSFKLVLPLTTAVTQVVMIRSGTLAIGVPANLVELVRRAPTREVDQAYDTGTYDFGGEQLPFFWSGALLQSSPRSTEPRGKTLPVVIFRSAAQRVAVHVDEVLGNQEVVVKNLGPQLSRLPGLAGMTVLASGAVVLIYNPVALTQVYGQLARQLSADRAQPGGAAAALLSAVPTVPLVMVVDDSITVRRVTQRLLQREGYRVVLASDGLQALEKLAEERPSVVLSDIEMPRMDGFDLARNIRADARLAQLPIVMITSRIAGKHREHARELGVNHYLGKPYSEEELLSLVKHYCTQAQAA